MPSNKEPLSPHLQIYRLPLTAILSISHRISGVILSIGAVLFVIVLICASLDAAVYNSIYILLDTTLGKLFIVLWVYALYFHLCTGIRHLLWDMCLGLELGTIKVSSYLIILFSIVFTFLTYI
jgi:succinate dehydrogenase / fumarate reductase cytochrome b subunit